jgi:hypothetical protein
VSATNVLRIRAEVRGTEVSPGAPVDEAEPLTALVQT